MSFAAAAVRMEDSLFARGGSDALWKSGGSGAGVPVKIVYSEPDADVRMGDERIVLSTFMLRVRRSEVASAAEGDLVVIETDTFKILSEPKLDKYRLIWTCEAQKVAP